MHVSICSGAGPGPLEPFASPPADIDATSPGLSFEPQHAAILGITSPGLC